MAAADRIRVLVVDDDPRFTSAVTALLEAAGMTVAGTAPDGEQALAAAAELAPDVITLDIDMPIMDGVEAAGRLRAAHPEVPIVVLTGSESSDRLGAALERGANAYVPKARAADDLADTIRAALAAVLETS